MWIVAMLGCPPPIPEGPPVGSAALSAAEGGAVASEDGGLTLTVPPGALTEDTTITVERLDQADWPAEIAENPPIGGVYAVGPEGTTFSTPVTFSWAFDAVPDGIVDAEGRHAFVLGTSRAADGTVESHLTSSAELDPEGVFGVESTVVHLSEHWLSTSVSGFPLGLAFFEVVPVRHELHAPFPATDLGILWSLDTDRITVQGQAAIYSGPLRVVPTDVWIQDDTVTRYTGDANDIVHDTSWTPPGMPEFECTGPGAGVLSVMLRVQNDVFYAERYLNADVECVEREVKPEFTTQSGELGDARIAPLGVPGSADVDLDANGGSYGYLIEIPPGATVRVCVTASGSAGVVYYPKHPPGFEYQDVSPAGCTEIENLDPDLRNFALARVTGTGTATVTTELLE
jgi:hypothetical protein